MTPNLLSYLCDPTDHSDLDLKNPTYDDEGFILSGELVSKNGNNYKIINGIPRFIDYDESFKKEVESFGNEWNYFNFDEFKLNWLNHTVKNTFGGVEFFAGKIVVDCGAGSGMQTRWISEAGASHVIALELSHSVDEVMKKNLQGFKNVDIIQCSIDKPPIKLNSINGVVICHNVIQHTPSVENTASALWSLVAEGGEFVFNCYPKNDHGILRKVRLYVYYVLRYFLSKMPFHIILFYSKFMSLIRLIPLLGYTIEKLGFMVRGDVPKGKNWLFRAYKSGVLNTYDCYGSHQYQHLKTNMEIEKLVNSLQSNPSMVLNRDEYFLRPQPIGIAIRLLK